MAAEHGWTPRHIEHELTDEHFVLLLDEAVDRNADRAQARFDTMVEAVRAGTIFAHDGRQHARWAASKQRMARKGLTGADLEAAVMGIARMFPGNVQRVTA
jgi:hypothetical protein